MAGARAVIFAVVAVRRHHVSTFCHRRRRLPSPASAKYYPPAGAVIPSSSLSVAVAVTCQPAIHTTGCPRLRHPTIFEIFSTMPPIATDPLNLKFRVQSLQVRAVGAVSTHIAGSFLVTRPIGAPLPIVGNLPAQSGDF